MPGALQQRRCRVPREREGDCFVAGAKFKPQHLAFYAHGRVSGHVGGAHAAPPIAAPIAASLCRSAFTNCKMSPA